MTHVSSQSAQLGAWALVSADSQITYHVQPDEDTIEFTLGGRDGLELLMSEAGLRHCIATFTEALHAVETATASQTHLPHSAGSAG